MRVEITETELNTRKSNGAVYICRSCKDNRNKITLLSFDPNGKKGIYYQFCNDCMNLVGECIPCKSKKV